MTMKAGVRSKKSEGKGTHHASLFTPYARLWMGIGILILLTPLGLILPGLFKAGGAWGEWGTEEIDKMLGYVPEGLRRMSELWSSPVPGYAFSGWDEGVKAYVAYVLSGILGIAIVFAVAYVLGRILKKEEQ